MVQAGHLISPGLFSTFPPFGFLCSGLELRFFFFFFWVGVGNGLERRIIS